ncbi:hypothetical protein L873DRAFT_1799997 [Choiromyces venosus 120613-1]|uniref:Uncharacterized protein n=1 Tax=Choiromyces venosus 120613-1 TaxID=1336337 RepID=A0A3N4K3U4_9PEZI|nr:hypothetical protein L873DRAFT_1799997 [Choiromyces venosus 120613-1]
MEGLPLCKFYQKSLWELTDAILICIILTCLRALIPFRSYLTVSVASVLLDTPFPDSIKGGFGFYDLCESLWLHNIVALRKSRMAKISFYSFGTMEIGVDRGALC